MYITASAMELTHSVVHFKVCQIKVRVGFFYAEVHQEVTSSFTPIDWYGCFISSVTLRDRFRASIIPTVFNAVDQTRCGRGVKLLAVFQASCNNTNW